MYAQYHINYICNGARPVFVFVILAAKHFRSESNPIERNSVTTKIMSMSIHGNN